MMHELTFTFLLFVLLLSCTSTQPLNFSSKGISAEDLAGFFEEDSAIIEMKYFHAWMNSSLPA